MIDLSTSALVPELLMLTLTAAGRVSVSAAPAPRVTSRMLFS
ncbi:hypothetical protein [Peterkaempfera sp. SMS 1(5)a]